MSFLDLNIDLSSNSLTDESTAVSSELYLFLKGLFSFTGTVSIFESRCFQRSPDILFLSYSKTFKKCVASQPTLVHTGHSSVGRCLTKVKSLLC